MALAHTKVDSGLQLLRACLGLTSALPSNEHFNNVVLAAIDFENLEYMKQDHIQDLDSQVGVAILDPKDLTSSPSQATISPVNFVTGSPSYCAATSGKFVFGKTVAKSQRDVLSNLEALALRTRKIVLVGHDLNNELNVLQFLKFDLSTSILGTLDTQRIAAEMIPGVTLKLCNILEELQSPFRALYNAGNDAYFTLQALLLLRIRSYSSEILLPNDHQDRLIALRPITQNSVLDRHDPQEKKRRKKLKRMQWNRKYQAKSWSTETQARIRAERAAQREEQDGASIWI